MNWAMLAVTVIVGLALPATIWTVFACSKDVHQYSKHYVSGRFSVELPEEDLEPGESLGSSEDWADVTRCV